MLYQSFKLYTLLYTNSNRIGNYLPKADQKAVFESTLESDDLTSLTRLLLQ